MDFSKFAAGGYGSPMAAAGLQQLANAFGGGGGQNPYLAQAIRQRQGQAPGGMVQQQGPDLNTPAVPGSPPQQPGQPGQPMPQQQGLPGQQGQPDPQMMQKLMQLMSQGGVGG